jgi:serine/threonine protein kinase
VLADFGLSKFLDGGPSTMSFQTRTSSGWGTGYYAAPEQYRDLKSADERTDIYALGILIWELFTEPGPPPDRQDSGMPAGLADVYLKASARKQSARFQSVAEFEEAFARALADGT